LLKNIFILLDHDVQASDETGFFRSRVKKRKIILIIVQVVYIAIVDITFVYFVFDRFNGLAVSINANAVSSPHTSVVCNTQEQDSDRIIQAERRSQEDFNEPQSGNEGVATVDGVNITADEVSPIITQAEWKLRSENPDIFQSDDFDYNADFGGGLT